MNINIKYLLFIFLVSINFINSHIIQYGREIEFNNVTSSNNIKVYNSNSNKLVLVDGGSSGVYHLVDKQVFEIIETFNFKEERELQVIEKSALFDETEENFYIVLTVKNQSKSILYKLDREFSIISSIEVLNEQVSPNQLYTLNYEKSTGIITFIGEHGIHRFEYEGNLTKIYGNFAFKNRHANFKLSTISYNDNILYIGGNDARVPIIMKFYLSHYGSGKRIQYLDSSINLNQHVKSVSDLLVYRRAMTFISNLKDSDSVYNGPIHQLNVFGFDNSFKIGVAFTNVKLSASDGNHIGIYIKDGSKENYGGRDLIYAIRIKDEDYRTYMVEVVSISYYRDDSIITGVYFAGDNKFIITTSNNTIQMIEVDPVKQSNEQVIPYSAQPDHHHHHEHHKDKHENKWWRVLFAVVFTGIGLILCCGIISLYIFIKKRDVITEFLKSNGFYKDKQSGGDGDDNGNLDSSQFATTIFFEKYQKLDSNNLPSENENEKIDIDTNNNNNNNNNNDSDSNSNNNSSGSGKDQQEQQQQQQSYQL